MIVGLIEKAKFTTTNLVIGEVQVHAEGYLDDRSIYKSLQNTEEIHLNCKRK